MRKILSRVKAAVPQSWRWRLPLTYALIALLAALALGVVLLTTLREYYVEREREYLREQAVVIEQAVERLFNAGVRPDAFQSSLQALAVLSQVQIRYYTDGWYLLVDSGDPTHAQIDLVLPAVSPAFPVVQYLEAPPDGSQPVTAVVPQPESSGEPGSMVFIQAYPASSAASASSFGFGITSEMSGAGVRSDQVVQVNLMDRLRGEPATLEITGGPAYGRAILNSVGRGWFISSVVAVGLAAGAGWLISLRLIAPLNGLTEVTSRMAKGDLSARAHIRDQGELGHLAQTFNEMASLVEEMVRTLRRFVADAAHELHTPLTALQTNIELAATEPDEKEREAFLNRALGELKRLELLTTNLLDLSRIETRAASTPHTPLDLAALVREMGEVYASRAEQAGIVFEFKLPDQPIRVLAHEAQMRCVVGNLLDNAIKFTPENGTIAIGVQSAEHQVRLWVQDTGIGIPKDDQPQLFSRFHRGRNAAAYAGSGLGLAITKAIAEAHRGHIEVESSVGRGTTFTLKFPEASAA